MTKIIEREWEETQIEYTNRYIKENLSKKTDRISDWYHTFGELYRHRNYLFIALCSTAVQFQKEMEKAHPNLPHMPDICTKTKVHNDWLDVGEEWGMFLLQLLTPNWPISYHFDLEDWDKCDFATELSIWGEFDWHTPDDVLDRLLDI